MEYTGKLRQHVESNEIISPRFATQETDKVSMASPPKNVNLATKGAGAGASDEDDTASRRRNL